MITTGREIHETPPEVQRELTRTFGLNSFGEPKYRCIWGWSAFDWVGGEFIETDRSGNYLRTVGDLRYMPIYEKLGANFWYFQKWLPAELFGTPSSWYSHTETVNGVSYSLLGPYPSRGKYETSLKLEDKGKFVQVTPSLVRNWCGRVEAAQRRKYAEILYQKYKEEAEEEERKAKFRHDVLWDDNQFVHGSHIVVPESYTSV